MRIIHVYGASNSGKSNSIRTYMKNQGVRFPLKGDFQIILPIIKGRKQFIVGIASGGDDAAVVNANFNFFYPRQCDVIVCASKTWGVSETETQKWVKQLQQQQIVAHQPFSYIPIRTRSVPRNQWPAEWARVAALIDQNIL